MKTSEKFYYLKGRELANIYHIAHNFKAFLHFIEEYKPKVNIFSQDVALKPELGLYYCAELKESEYQALLSYTNSI